MHEKKTQIVAIRLPESAQGEQEGQLPYFTPDGAFVPGTVFFEWLHVTQMPDGTYVTEPGRPSGDDALLHALDHTFHTENDPVEDVMRFTACVTQGYVPPPDVLRRFATAFKTYLARGESGHLESFLGLAATRGKRPPIKAARENRALREALWLMATLEQSAGARIPEAALLVAAKLQAERRLDKSVNPLPATTLEYNYRRRAHEIRRQRRAPMLGFRRRMFTAEEAKEFLATFPDGDLEVRIAKKRILHTL